MGTKQIAAIQQGLWIDSQRLAEAGLNGELEIGVQPGEIRIHKSGSSAVKSAGAADDLILRLAGTLAGRPASSVEIDRDLYGDGGDRR